MGTSFDTTNWGVIAAACSLDLSKRQTAFAIVFETYRSPIEAWYRRRGVDAQRAEEMAQDLLGRLFIDRRLLSSASPERGRMRALLKQAAHRHWVDEVRRDTGRNRRHAASTNNTPDTAAHDFDAEWARAQLQSTIDRARSRMIESGRHREWLVFELAVLQPSVFGTKRPSMSDVARDAGLPSAAEASAFLHQAKRRIRLMFDEVVSETVGASGDYRDEIQCISDMLSGRN